jgi:hypothetical protein
VLESARLVLFFAALAGAGANAAMFLARLPLHPWLRVTTYALPVMAVLLIVVAGLRAPRFVIPPKIPLVLKVLVAGVLAFAAIHVAMHLRHAGDLTFTGADTGTEGRRAVTSSILAGYAVAIAVLWRRVPKRPSRF